MKDAQQGTENTGKALFPEFEPHTKEQWRTAAEQLLKGRPFDKVMLTKTPEDIVLQPIYRKEDIQGLAHLGDAPGLSSRVRASRPEGYLENGWDISQELPYGDPKEFNEALLSDLGRGQSEVNMPLDMATSLGLDADQAAEGEVGMCGVSLSSLCDMEIALNEVDLNCVSSYIQSGYSALPTASFFLAAAKKKGADLSTMRASIGADPLGWLVTEGRTPQLDALYNEMSALTEFAAEKAAKVQTITISGMPYSNGGASATQELGYVLATAVEYLREMGERGLEVDQVAPRMRFIFSLGANYFMEIAKLRAARILWSQIIDAFGGSEESKNMHLHARTATVNKTRRDPFVNMLRTTTESFSAVIGGANSIHTSPYDEIFQTPDEFSRRIARNQQVILQEECELTRTVDPAGGSWYVEKLTDEVCQKAWGMFQDIEAKGGMLKALQAGIPQEAVASTLANSKKMIGQRRTSIVGTNNYPNAAETLEAPKVPCSKEMLIKRAAVVTRGEATEAVEALKSACSCGFVSKAIAAAEAGATLSEIASAKAAEGETTLEKQILPVRLSEDFEALRDASDEFKAKTGSSPAIFQANMGASRGYRLRADWTTAFFETAGFAVQKDQDFDSNEAAVKAAMESGSKVVVITSSDDTYAECVETLAKALKAANSEFYVIVAGLAGDKEAAWREAGVDDFVNVKANNYELNKKLLQLAGVIA